MSYPFTQGMPLRELIERLTRDHGVEKGKAESGPFLWKKRKDGGTARWFYGELDPEARLLPSKLYNVLRRFGVDPSEFGLDLEGPDPDGTDES